MATTRRLAAILAADVAGYSRLMGSDEEGTHRRLQAHFAGLVHPKIEEHWGRVVKNTGDGLLAEFASVVDAVRCAVEMQRGMADCNSAIPAQERIEFRVGINLGDVIAEADDIFGDAVNVAARLEALAAPGSICLSRMVHDQIRDKLPYAFEDLGEQHVKNIARPVRVYTLRPGAVGDPPAPGVPTPPLISHPVDTPRLSIVVLPFANLSKDPEQQYFADGVSEDLTTDLSRLTGMLVISRNTALTYRNKSTDTRQIGRELGVRYVLEGSVRRSGGRVRVNAQLIEAATDAHLWAERFESDASDLFVLQDEIVSRIAIALNIELIAAEAKRRTEHPDALDYIFRARAMVRPPTPEDRAKRIIMYERALAIDPHSAEAQSGLAYALVGRVLADMSDTAAVDLERARRLSEQALATSLRSPLAHQAKGDVLRAQGKYAEAISEYEKALVLDRNWVAAFFPLSQCKFFTGAIEETIPLIERAIRLSPRDPQTGQFYFQIGRVRLLQSRTEEAITWLEKARNQYPAHPVFRAQLAAAYALAGETERGAAELAEARRLSADDRFSSLAGERSNPMFYGAAVAKVRALYEATYFEGLRKAGMPEE
jgi:adenylate cyclase